jgi:hypothetical protein
MFIFSSRRIFETCDWESGRAAPLAYVLDDR